MIEKRTKKRKEIKMKKIILTVLSGLTIANAGNINNCNWALKEVNILTKELQYNIDNVTKKSKQDTSNNLADEVQYAV